MTDQFAFIPKHWCNSIIWFLIKEWLEVYNEINNVGGYKRICNKMKVTAYPYFQA